MPPGTRFDWHTHEDHQLAWAASGVLTVLTADATWVLPPTRALWIPAGLPHETASDGGRATMRSLYIRPGLFPVSWAETGRPTPVAASVTFACKVEQTGGGTEDDQDVHERSVRLLDVRPRAAHDERRQNKKTEPEGPIDVSDRLRIHGVRMKR